MTPLISLKGGNNIAILRNGRGKLAMKKNALVANVANVLFVTGIQHILLLPFRLLLISVHKKCNIDFKFNEKTARN